MLSAGMVHTPECRGACIVTDAVLHEQALRMQRGGGICRGAMAGQEGSAGAQICQAHAGYSSWPVAGLLVLAGAMAYIPSLAVLS